MLVGRRLHFASDASSNPSRANAYAESISCFPRQVLLEQMGRRIDLWQLSSRREWGHLWQRWSDPMPERQRLFEYSCTDTSAKSRACTYAHATCAEPIACATADATPNAISKPHSNTDSSHTDTINRWPSITHVGFLLFHRRLP